MVNLFGSRLATGSYCLRLKGEVAIFRDRTSDVMHMLFPIVKSSSSGGLAGSGKLKYISPHSARL